MEPEIFKNLMMLKYYEGDVEDLGLSFMIDEDHLGQTRNILLVPNGDKEQVTNDNKLEFIMYYADYMLNKKVRTQTQAFV